MLGLFSKRKRLRSTPFSKFIREASAEEKKRVYAIILRRAVERQTEILDAEVIAFPKPR